VFGTQIGGIAKKSEMETRDRVKLNTPARVNEQIEKQILESIRYYSHNKNEISSRLMELDEEWDIERALELNAALVALAGTVLAATFNRKWLILPALVTVFLGQHAAQGWCPPLPLLRSLGFRTRQEIDSEKYALKALQGTLKAGHKASELFEAVMH
jgi:hypothetical protein